MLADWYDRGHYLEDLRHRASRTRDHGLKSRAPAARWRHLRARATSARTDDTRFLHAWLSALATIIVIDLVLAGDNAIVIGLAARNVPKEMQKRVVLWGTAGAIVVASC